MMFFNFFCKQNSKLLLFFIILQFSSITDVYASFVEKSNVKEVFFLKEKLKTQDIEVSGTIIDVNGVPLIGVSILIKGTSKGTTTDFDGNYTLKDVSSEASIEYSYLGYITQLIKVGGQTIINITMQEDEEQLEAVVIIGYGTQKKSDVTGAISLVDIDTFEKTVSPFATQALQGLVSGVNVTANTGAPGEGAQIRIRGAGSILGSNSPLYIVDGVPTKNALDYLSPSDIENISVLKDGASAAIYGSRATNGVVIITTKKGKKGASPKITFSSLFGIQSVGKLTEMTSKDQYIEVYNEAADNDNALLPNNPELHRRKISAEYAATLPNIDHLDAVFREATLQQYHLGFSGGSEKTTYNISGSYFDQEGILLGSSYNKLTGKIGLNSEIKDWLTVGTNINIYNDEQQVVGSSGDGFGGNGGSAIRYAFFRSPAIPIYDDNGNFVDLPDEPGFFGDGYNPVGVLLIHQDNVKRNYGVFGDINFKIKLSNQLTFVSTIGIDRSNFKQERFDRTWGTNNRINNPNTYTVTTGLISNWSMSNVLNYNHNINDIHQISAILGAETIGEKFESVVSSDRDFADQDDLLVELGNGDGIKSVNGFKEESKLQSFFARVNYNYDEKYFVSAILRLDGSSKFADGNRWSTFPSASFGWKISNEKFFENITFIDKWMFRAGYGSNGNQEIRNFAYLELIGNNFNYPFGDVSQSGNTITKFGNELVQWETSNQIDIGTDLSFLKGKLDITIDYYHKTTDKLLAHSPIPLSAGYAEAAIVNAGKVLNSGVELEIKYRDYISDSFSYSINANAALLHNEVLEYDAPLPAGRIDNGVFATRTEVGQPIGSFFLYEMEGIFQNELEVFTSAIPGGNVLPGDVKYKDQNGDGVIDGLDRRHVGSPIPDVTFGLNAELNYKNIDFSLFIAGAYGQEIYYQVATDIEGFYRPFNLTKRYYDERWTGEGTSNTQPRASWKAKANNTLPSTRFLEDGSYIRLKNIQLGYTIPQENIQKYGVSKFRIYISASNILTLTKYPGLDPEQTTSNNSSSEGDLAAGIDWGTYPTATSFNLGFQITF